MSSLEALEAALRIELDRETLLVYADELLAAGDPRGELIAIDLAEASEERAARRAELIGDWLGPSPPHGTIRYGFIDVDATSAQPWEQLAVALDGPAARYVRGVTAVGDRAAVELAIGQIASAERPWLARVTLRQWAWVQLSEQQRQHLPERARRAVSGDSLAAAFARATPALHTLEVDGRHVLDPLAHARVHRVRVSGHDALASLHDGTPWPIEALDFAFVAHLDVAPKPHDLGALLPAASFPALRHLDLSRNEPGQHDPDHLGGKSSAFELLLASRLRAQLVSLRVPTPRDADLDRLRSALAGMPALRTLDVRGPRIDLAHATAQIRFFA